jgi:O-antigen/teichoic acid export membrane protein
MVKARASSVHSAVSGTIFVFAGRLSDAVVGFLFSIVGARLMGKDLYGFVGATIGIISILSMLADMGVPNATTKYVSEYLAKKKLAHIRAVMFNTMLLEAILGGLAAILCFVLADPLATSVFGKPELGIYLRYGAPLAFLTPLMAAFNAGFQGYQRQEFYTLSMAVSGFTRLISSTVFLLYSPTVESALLGYLIGAVVGSAMFGILVMVTIIPTLGKRTAPRWPEFKKMLGYSVPVMLTAASIMLFNWIGTLFLTAFGRPEEISWFNIAYGMVNIPVVLSTSIGTAYFPIVTDLHSRGRHKLLSDSYSRAIKFTSFVMIPVVLILMAVGPLFIFVLYGPEFMPAYEPFIILSLWGLVRPIAAISNAVSNGVGKPFLNTKANLICLGLSVVLCAFLIPSVRPYPLNLIPISGVMGASWAVTLSFIVGMSLQVYYSLEVTKTRLPFDSWGKFLLASTLSAFVMVIIFRQIIQFLGGAHSILMSGLVAVGLSLLGLGIYLGIVKLMGALDKDDVALIGSMPLPMKKTILRFFKALVP